MIVQTFASEAIGSIRAKIMDGDPYFYGVDLARILGYSDTEALTRRIDKEDVSTCTDDSSGQIRTYTLLSESGMYAAILGSSKAEARSFKRWVTSEVLPQIRKTGAYHSIPKTFAEALQLAADQAKTIETQALQIEAARPAVAFMDEYVEAKSTRDISTVGKTLGFGPKAFFAKLAEMGVMFRRGGCWVPYQAHMDAGRFEVKTGTKHGHTWHQSRFTPKGVAWIAMQISGSP